MPTTAVRSAIVGCAFVLALGGCESSEPRDGGFPDNIAGSGGVGGAAGAGVSGQSSGGAAGTNGGVGGLGGVGGGGTGGLGGVGGMNGGTGGTAGGGAGGMNGGTGGSGEMSVAGIPEQELAMLRQVCVDEINMYRATLSLPPMDRADPEQELCSDQGAKKDGDSMAAHSSAGRGNPCASGGGVNPGFGSQNTCPGWPVGGFGGGATIADALKGCLESMWDEGEPPGGTQACIDAYFDGDTECFLAHGHYINMKGDAQGVSCGFYKMTNGRYWMNQDFY